MALESEITTSPSSSTGTWPNGFSFRKSGFLCAPALQVDFNQVVGQAKQRDEQTGPMRVSRQRMVIKFHEVLLRNFLAGSIPDPHAESATIRPPVRTADVSQFIITADAMITAMPYFRGFNGRHLSRNRLLRQNSLATLIRITHRSPPAGAAFTRTMPFD